MKNIRLCFLLAFPLFIFLGACGSGEEDIGKILFREFRNPALKEITPAVVAPELEKVLNGRKMKYGDLVLDYYRKKQYAPVLLKAHLADGGAEALLERLERAGEHGLDSNLFQPDRLRRLADSLKNKEAISTAGEAIPVIAQLESEFAAALAAYGLAMQYGYTDPAEIFPRYYIETERPDSASLTRLYESDDLDALLDSIQPSGSEYKTMQAALLKGPASDTGQAEQRQALVANLERLRWKNKPGEEKYVLVNIPDFRLYVMEKGKPVLNMKVCVGEPARRWQTPQLNSLIERAQVNPIWHIPKSIASNEIIQKAAADPYYLENANIDVYENGEKVEDSRKIKWKRVSDGEMPYSFKQRPGSQNALGKIKFLFENQSSVYLHDTPVKAAFDRENRAVSHGCVRVEKPLELAEALFGPGGNFELIKTEMGKDQPKAQNVELSQPVPVYLTYATCWVDENNTLQYRPDVYGLDSILLTRLQASEKSLQTAR